MTIAKQLTQTMEPLLEAVYEAGKKAGGGDGDTATKYATQLNRSFYNADFPEGYELTVDVYGTTNLAEMFRNSIRLEKLTVRCPESAVIAANYFLYTTTTRASSLKELTLPDGIKFSNFANFASRCSVLKTIRGRINLSESSSNNDCFSYCYELENIGFVEKSINSDISFAHATKLKGESIRNIMWGMSATYDAPKVLTLSRQAVDDAFGEYDEDGTYIPGYETDSWLELCSYFVGTLTVSLV